MKDMSHPSHNGWRNQMMNVNINQIMTMNATFCGKPNNEPSVTSPFFCGVYHPQKVPTLPHYLLHDSMIVAWVNFIAWTPTLGSSVRIDLGRRFLRVGRGPETGSLSTSRRDSRLIGYRDDFARWVSGKRTPCEMLLMIGLVECDL